MEKTTDDINITLPIELIKQMDEHRGYKKRSEYIRDLIIENLRQSELAL